MFVQDALFSAKKALRDLCEAEILLAHALQRDRAYLLAHRDEELSSEATEDFFESVGKRKSGKPISYIIRRKEFFGLELYVDERCFIPRPETEILVETVLDEIARGNSRPVNIIDIGTGSGAIAVALAKSLPNARVTAVDISKDALEVARLNAKKHNVAARIDFLESDLLSGIPEAFLCEAQVIVANLPYIGTEKFSFAEREVRENEPSAALFGGIDGLYLYGELFRQIFAMKKRKENLASLDFLCVEFGFLQRDSLSALLNKFFVRHEFKHEFKKDLAGIDRVCIVRF